MSKKKSNTQLLPIKHKLMPYYILSIIIAFVITGICIIGAFFPEWIYPTEEWIHVFVPNDVANLAIGLPVLIISMFLAKSGKLMGLLSWLGAVFYVLYSYFFYLLAAPFGMLFLAYLLLVTLSLVVIIGIAASINGEAAKQRFENKASERFAAVVMLLFGLLIAGRVINLIITAGVKQTVPAVTEIALHIADFIFAVPLLIIGGIQLWRKKNFGYIAGPSVLFMYGILSLALILVMILQSRMTGTELDNIGIIVVGVMVLLCVIPYALFAKTVSHKRK